MKKIIITLLLFCGVALQAQIKGGATLLYGTEIESLGFGLKGTYGINDKLTASGEINYFLGQSEDTGFVKASTRLITIDADANYFFNTNTSELMFYGIGGLNVSIIRSSVKFDDSAFGGFGGSDRNESTSKLGLNIGAGFLYPLTNQLELVTEATYTLSDFDQLVLQTGILYTFKNK